MSAVAIERLVIGSAFLEIDATLLTVSLLGWTSGME
jgi:hypothetical protein